MLENSGVYDLKIGAVYERKLMVNGYILSIIFGLNINFAVQNILYYFNR